MREPMISTIRINDRGNWILSNIWDGIKKQAKQYQTVLLSAIVFGCLTYIFAFTNKLVNFDDVNALFGKGASLSSGRWGLDYLSWLFPNFSMPWIYGVIGILLATMTVCLVVSVFEINNPVLQVLLTGLMLTFPSLIGTSTYTFAFSSYMLALFMSVAAVWCAVKDRFGYKIIGVVLSVFQLSIYQPYLSVTASLLVVLLFSYLLIKKMPVLQVLKCGFIFLIHLILAVGIYYGILQLLLYTQQVQFNEYASEMTSTETTGLPQRLKRAYTMFVEEFLRGSFGFIPARLSRILHVLCLGYLGTEIAYTTIKSHSWKIAIFVVFLMLILPLSISAMTVATGGSHALMFYGFVSVYVLLCLLVENRTDKLQHNNVRLTMNNCVTIAMLVIIISNIYTANQAYLREYLAYENAYSFYTSLVTQIKSDPDFNAGTKLALIGETNEMLYDFSDFEKDGYIVGTHGFDVNDYSRNNFIRYFIGFDIDFASDEEISSIISTPEYQEMEVYPYYGSVKKITNRGGGDVIVVKMGDVKDED